MLVQVRLVELPNVQWEADAALVPPRRCPAVAQVGLSWSHARASAVMSRPSASRGRCLVDHHDLRRLKRLLLCLRVHWVKRRAVQRDHLVIADQLTLQLSVVRLRVLLGVLLVLGGFTFLLFSVVLCLLCCERDVLLRQVIEPELELGVLLLGRLVLAAGEGVQVCHSGAGLVSLRMVASFCMLDLLLLRPETFLVACRLLAEFQGVRSVRRLAVRGCHPSWNNLIAERVLIVGGGGCRALVLLVVGLLMCAGTRTDLGGAEGTLVALRPKLLQPSTLLLLHNPWLLGLSVTFLSMRMLRRCRGEILLNHVLALAQDRALLLLIELEQALRGALARHLIVGGHGLQVSGLLALVDVVGRADDERVLVVLGMQLLDVVGVRLSPQVLRLLDTAEESTSAGQQLVIVYTVQVLASLHAIRGHVHLVVSTLVARVLEHQIQVRKRLLHIGWGASDRPMSHVALRDQRRLRTTWQACRAMHT